MALSRILTPMSIWSRIAELLAALRKGESLVVGVRASAQPARAQRGLYHRGDRAWCKAGQGRWAGHPHRGRGLSPGVHHPAEEEANAARVFNLARQDVAGFDQYAAKIAAMFQPGDPVLVDLLEGLFKVACADGNFTPQRKRS